MTDTQLCLFYARFATSTLFLCCTQPITPLVKVQRDVVIQLRYIRLVLLLAVDYRSGRHRRVVQQGFCVQISARCCCVAAPECFRFIVGPAAQRDADIQLRHKCVRFAARV